MVSENLSLLIGLLAFLGGGGFLFIGMKRWKRTQLIKNTPTEDVESLAFGRTELQGTVEPMSHVMGQPFSEGECVYSWHQIKEYQRNARRTENGDKKKWVTIDEGENIVDFAVKDDTGTAYIDIDDDPDVRVSGSNRKSISVNAHEAEPEAVQRFLEHNNYATKHDGVSGVLSGMRRRYKQAVLPIGEDVYVFGSAEETDDGETVLRRDEETGEFIVSDKGADSLATRLNREAAGMAIVGGSFIVIGFYIVLVGFPAPV